MFYKKKQNKLSGQDKRPKGLPKKSIYALTFGHVCSRRQLKRLVAPRYIEEGN